MPSIFEPIFRQAETYGKTTVEILKLKAVSKAADIGSTLYSRTIFLVTTTLFIFSSTVALALWLGELTGKNLYGFLIVSAIYGLASLVVFFTHPFIKSSASNSITKQLLKQ